jgi:hypothetical protein
VSKSLRVRPKRPEHRTAWICGAGPSRKPSRTDEMSTGIADPRAGLTFAQAGAERARGGINRRTAEARSSPTKRIRRSGDVLRLELREDEEIGHVYAELVAAPAARRVTGEVTSEAPRPMSRPPSGPERSAEKLISRLDLPFTTKRLAGVRPPICDRAGGTTGRDDAARSPHEAAGGRPAGPA